MLQITKPTLLLNKEICRKNIKKMIDKASANNITLRPHFKTHQSHQIASIFREYGVEKCTVSSVSMAEYFAADSWNDITIAFPFNLHEIEKINAFDENIRINLCLEDSATAINLNSLAKRSFSVFIKIDTGNHRTGMDCHNMQQILDLINTIDDCEKLEFVGLLSHAGHSYKAKSRKEILDIHNDNRAKLIALKEFCQANSQHHNIILSTGDTPTAMIAEEFAGLDELRPGVFVYFDLMMAALGVCSYDDIAICYAAPIVAKHKERLEVVVYAGAVHLSKDAIYDDKTLIYGKLVRLDNEFSWSNPIENSYLYKLSQEHSIIKVDGNTFESLEIGEIIGILPIHACLSTDKMSQLLALDGEKIEMMKY